MRKSIFLLLLILSVIVGSKASSKTESAFGGQKLLGKKIKIEKGNKEDWFSGPSFRVKHPEYSDYTFYFWSQEAWSETTQKHSQWEFIKRANYKDICFSPNGIIGYELSGLLNPNVSFNTQIESFANEIEVIYTIRNNSKKSLYIVTNPCFQLDEKLFEGISPEKRNSYVSISLPTGVTAINETQLSQGSKRDKPWTQIYFGHQNPFKPKNHGFGLNKQNVNQGFIYMNSPKRDLNILIASDEFSSVAYAFLNCLHVDIGGWIRSKESKKIKYKIYFGKKLKTIKKRAKKDFDNLSFKK